MTFCEQCCRLGKHHGSTEQHRCLLTKVRPKSHAQASLESITCNRMRRLLMPVSNSDPETVLGTLQCIERQFERCLISTHSPLRPSTEFFMEVGRVYDETSDETGNTLVHGSYAKFKLETAAQFSEMLNAGLSIRPWLKAGQPYRSSDDLRAQVTSTGSLFVFLTRRGHGTRSGPTPEHPLCERSGIAIDGEPFLYNDLFRAVHDGIGHVLHPNNFGLRGELRAAFAHMSMYSERATRALFTETVGQICWFYCGPHMLAPGGGRPLRQGEPGYIPSDSRPYPDQRVFLFTDRLIQEFLGFCEKAVI